MMNKPSLQPHKKKPKYSDVSNLNESSHPSSAGTAPAPETEEELGVVDAQINEPGQEEFFDAQEQEDPKVDLSGLSSRQRENLTMWNRDTKSAPAARPGRTRATVLSLSAELLAKLLSYVAYQDRLKHLRLVCRQLKTAVGLMPPEMVKVVIHFEEPKRKVAWDLEWNDEKPGSEGWNLNAHKRMKEDPDGAQTMIEIPSVPPLFQSGPPIRQMILHVYWPRQCPVFRRNSQLKITSTSNVLKELSLTGMTEWAAMQVEKILMPPEIQKLCISKPRAPLAKLLPSIISSFKQKKVRAVTIELTDELVPAGEHPDDESEVDQLEAVGLPLAFLKEFPQLDKLTIEDTTEDMTCNESIMNGFMVGLTEIHQLKRLDFFSLFLWSAENCLAFGNMLNSMPNLQEVRKLSYCMPERSERLTIWERIHEAGLKTHPLKKLVLDYSEVTRKELQQLVEGCKDFFPDLQHLRVSFINTDISLVDGVAKGLVGLKNHPSLKVLSVETDEFWKKEEEELLTRHLKSHFGVKIAVEMCPYEWC